MKTKVLIFLSLFFAYSSLQGQTLFLSDCFRGGVVADGYNPWYYGDSGYVQLPIPPGSTIKKALLFANFSYIKDSALNPYDHIIEINNQQITLSSNQSLNISHNFFGPNYQLINIPITYEITSLISPTNPNHLINPNSNNIPVYQKPIYHNFHILVFYENINLPITCIESYINNQEVKPIQNFIFNLQNPYKNIKDIGLSINGDHFCDHIADRSFIYINGDSIGQIGGAESNTNINCGGPIGSFYYENESLFGLGNDTPDSLMSGLDAIAKINSYFQGSGLINLTCINPLPTPANPNYPYSNQFNYFFLAYTSPCDTFSTKHTPDTTVCHGAQVPLFASGGQSYEWSPQVGLSCFDCPNPIFSADSSRYYSLRIWNNDSCSKVLPIFIKVNPPTPNFNVDITPSECGDSTGSIKINPLLNTFTYINHTTLDTSSTGEFLHLSSGNYHISILDSLGCGLDTLIHVPETLSVQAAFTSNPNAGISPLTVQFSNQSTGASSYQWIYDNQTSTNVDVLHTFGQDGIYPIILYAYGNSPLCVDTAYDTIRVYLPLVVDIPNIFTPDNNSINEEWGVKINTPATIDVQIFNRWGEVVLNKNQEATTPGFIALWDGGKHVGGVYFYVIRVQTDFEKVEYRGNITIVK